MLIMWLRHGNSWRWSGTRWLLIQCGTRLTCWYIFMRSLWSIETGTNIVRQMGKPRLDVGYLESVLIAWFWRCQFRIFTLLFDHILHVKLSSSSSCGCSRRRCSRCLHLLVVLKCIQRWWHWIFELLWRKFTTARFEFDGSLVVLDFHIARILLRRNAGRSSASRIAVQLWRRLGRRLTWRTILQLPIDQVACGRLKRCSMGQMLQMHRLRSTDAITGTVMQASQLRIGRRYRSRRRYPADIDLKIFVFDFDFNF